MEATEGSEVVAACAECHSETFAREELAKGDPRIRETDRLLGRERRARSSLFVMPGRAPSGRIVRTDGRS